MTIPRLMLPIDPFSGNREDRIETKNAAMAAQEPALVLCRDVVGGTATMRAATGNYLPQHPGELFEDYVLRLNRSILFNALHRTIKGLSGMVFRRDPELSDDVPEKLATHWENIDNAGTHGDVFSRRVLEDAMVAGYAGIFVEYPEVVGPMTLAEERAQQFRPYWRHVKKDDILGFRTEVQAGKVVLTQLRMQEIFARPKGNWGDEVVTSYRVVENRNQQITWTTWELNDKNEPVLTGQGVYGNQTEIPFAIVYAGSVQSLLVAGPPLLDLAYTNVCHYQVQSDHLTALHKASVPIFCMIGMDMVDDAGDRLVVGPNTALRLPSGADAKYVEHSGSALGQSRQQLEDLKGEMAILGLSMLSPDKRVAETAEAKRMDKAEGDSTLASLARSLQDALETAFQYHADYMQIDAGGSVMVNREFEDLVLTPQEIEQYSQLVLRGQWSLETLWEKLKEGNVLPENFDEEIEEERISTGMLPDPTGREPIGTTTTTQDEEE